MALDQLVWSFGGNDYRVSRGYKTFYTVEGDLRFENNRHDPDSSVVRRGVVLNAIQGKSAGLKLDVDDSGINQYQTGFHIFATEKGAVDHNRQQINGVVVPVFFSRYTALGVQYKAPIVVARFMYVPTIKELAQAREGVISDIAAEEFFMHSLAGKIVPLFDYKPYVSPAMAEKIGEN